jgi:hypothetical protein
VKVFCEWHHGGLFHAQQLLWEKRLGGQVFAPVGFEWVKEGFWRYSENPDTQRQYLEPGYCFEQGNHKLFFFDKGEQINQRRISLEDFKKEKFDIILCTLQEHEESFRRLRDEYQPDAAYIRLVGNTGEQVDWNRFNNFIDTTGLYAPPSGINAIVIGQEFPLDTFYYREPTEHKTITNLMNCLKEADAYGVWSFLKRELPGFKFFMHGSQGEDGMVDGLHAIGEKIRDSSFIFQVKHHGEGFGHIIHNAYACGRPVIGVLEYYKGKLAERFLLDGHSAILLDDKPPDQVLHEILFYSQPEEHKKMCENARALFEKYVSFDNDFERFKVFLTNLKH